MPDFLLIKIIENLDKQLGLLNIESNILEQTATPLLNLRNLLLKEYVSQASKLDWTIKNESAIKVLNKINWLAVWNS